MPRCSSSASPELPAVENPRHIHRSRISFGDTDCSGRLHFPAIFRHVEEAEHAFFREFGLPVIGRETGGWPRVHVSCDYRRPLHFDDEIEVRLAVGLLGETSVTWHFEILKDGHSAASGKIVAVRVDSSGSPVPIDETTRALLIP